MRPTLGYINERFDYFNRLCFEGKLKHPVITLSTRYASMGRTITEYRYLENGKKIPESIRIEISVRRDLPEYEYTDTLLHEMVHYYIISNNLEDDSPHGSIFRQKMEEITEKSGFRITIAFEPSEEEMIKTITRPRYVCTAESQEGDMLIAVVARNKIFQLWDCFSNMPDICNIHWYVSDRQIFEIFPVAVSPRLIKIDAHRLHHFLTGAKELTNNGTTISIKQP